MKNIETVVDLQDLQSIPMKDHKATAMIIILQVV